MNNIYYHFFACNECIKINKEALQQLELIKNNN